MTRIEMLRLQRKEILFKLENKNETNRTRLLIALMDADDELEELGRSLKVNETKTGGPSDEN